MQLLRIALVVLVPRLLCSSVKSIKILAALCPEIRNPTVLHLSIQPLHFCCVYLQPACVQMSTYSRIYNPFQTERNDTREDAHNHRANFPDGPASETLSSRCTSTILLCRCSEEGTDFGVDFARSFSSCRKLHLSPLEHCPFAFH